MRSVLIHPNRRACGAEIAGTWPPARIVYRAGYLKADGYLVATV